MAIYRRNYKPYAGALTPAWSRCFVLFRYSRRNLFRSKFLTALFVVCFFYPVVCLLLIYLAHSASFLAADRCTAARSSRSTTSSSSTS